MGTEKPGVGAAKQKAVSALSVQERKELESRLSMYESVITDPKGIFHHVLTTTNHEFFNAWADDMAQAIESGLIDMDMRDISSYITRKLRDAGLEYATGHARDSLPAKYKRHDPNPGSADNPRSNSSLYRVECPKCGYNFAPTIAERKAFLAVCLKCGTEIRLPNYEERNARALKLMEAMEDAIKIAKSKMRTGPWIEKIDPADFDESEKIGYATIQFLLEALDDRQGVPVATQHELLMAATRTNLDDAATFYFKDVKEKLDLTRKQTHKIVTLRLLSQARHNGEYDFTRIKDIKGKMHIMLEPTSPFQSRRIGFSGEQCPKCGCLRTEPKYRSIEPELFCNGCHHWFPKPEPAIFVEKPKGHEMEIGKNGKIKLTPVG